MSSKREKAKNIISGSIFRKQKSSNLFIEGDAFANENALGGALYMRTRASRALEDNGQISSQETKHHKAISSSLRKSTNRKVFDEMRSKLIDDDENSGWTTAMIDTMFSGVSFDEHRKAYLTAIRKGVPDHLKRSVLLQSFGTGAFLRQHPNYAAATYKHAFGSILPQKTRRHIPAFAVGFSGTEIEIQETTLNEVASGTPKTGSGSNLWGTIVSQYKGFPSRPRGATDIIEVNATDSSSKLSTPAECRAQSFNMSSSKDEEEEIEATSKIKEEKIIMTSTTAPTTTCSDGQSTSPPKTTTGGDITHVPSFPKLGRIRSGSMSDCPSDHLDYSPQEIPRQFSEGVMSTEPISGPLIILRKPTITVSRMHPGSPHTPALNLETMSPSSESSRLVSLSSRGGIYSKDEILTESVLTPTHHHHHAHHPSARTNFVLGTSPMAMKTDQTTATTTSGKLIGQAYTLETVTEYYRLLDPDGQHAAKRVLWCLNSQKPQLEFGPFFVPLCCSLLCYLTEEETLTLMLRMVDKSTHLIKTNSKHVLTTLKKSDFIQFIHLALDICSRQLPSVVAKLKDLGVDLAVFFVRCIQDLFTKVLPFDMCVRITVGFVFEGMKLLLRYSLAILTLQSADLLKCSTWQQAQAVLLCRELRYMTPTLSNELTKIAFRMEINLGDKPLSSYISNQLSTPYLMDVKSSTSKFGGNEHPEFVKFYRPRLHHQSALLDDDDWMTLWMWLSPTQKILDPLLTFDSQVDGMTVLCLERKLWESSTRPMLFVLKTDKDDILGGFAPFPFSLNCQSRKPLIRDLSSSFVFQLKPNQMAFHWTGKTETLMNVSLSMIAFGCQECSIYLDGDLHRGASHPSLSFDSPSLVSGNDSDFRIKRMEVWLLE